MANGDSPDLLRGEKATLPCGEVVTVALCMANEGAALSSVTVRTARVSLPAPSLARAVMIYTPSVSITPPGMAELQNHAVSPCWTDRVASEPTQAMPFHHRASAARFSVTPR